MSFPFQVIAQLSTHTGTLTRKVIINGGFTILLGPNGSGKTHLLRGLRNGLSPYAGNKKVRFLSAGRIGLLEQFRSDFNGHNGGQPNYDNATYGSKNDTTRRHQTETLSGDYQTLALRTDILIKIQERLRKLFKRDLLVEWDAGNLKLSFSRLDHNTAPYSSGREASGLMHLVGILAALYDDEVGALLLDEPEVSLHPQLQAFLLREILSVAGHPSAGGNKKLVIVATHSTEMLRICTAGDLLSLVFCYDLDSDPVQIAPDADELKNRKLQGLISRLGQEHKLALFCKRPLLVEGTSDAMICSALASKTGRYLEAAGSQLLPVIGKGNMGLVTKLLRLLGKDPVALTDADGIADGLELVNQYLSQNEIIDASANDLGFKSARDMASDIFGDFCRLVDTRWCEIAPMAQSHPYWSNRTADNDAQARRRASFCTLFSVECEQLATLGKDSAWRSMRARMTSLLDLLEKAGLFVLRRGSIESYYVNSDRQADIGKPSVAACEVERIEVADRIDIEHLYADVVRCVQFASHSETISEAEALRDLLLSIVSPAHARLRDGGTTQDPNVLARSILGERSKVFSLSVADNALTVSIESHILDVSNFSLTIHSTDDVLKRINSALGIDQGLPAPSKAV